MFYNSLVNDYRKVTFMLTIKEVAQAANLSVATVSRVLNHDKRVALKTKEHVLKVVKELDYTPNTLGRNLRVSATKNPGASAVGSQPVFFQRHAGNRGKRSGQRLSGDDVHHQKRPSD